MNYDFSALNDKEFEILCTDILSTAEGARFERFKPGKDNGIDGRYFKNGKEIILQCKHWKNTPTGKLIVHLRKTELPKLQKIAPHRYIIAISKPLSRHNKESIKQALSPHLNSTSDIYGLEDLNDLLSKHPEIERRHYKLWISSSNTLNYFLNKPIHDRSEFLLEEILESAKLYAVTENHHAALEKLERLGVIIITGEPGVGKTTLADHLCLHHVLNGFKLLKISDDIREAESAYEKDKKQIFYFDDFLGRNYLEALSGHEGSHIVQFIRRITKDKEKKFILTSRSTILNQGKILIDLLKNQNIDKNEYELTVSKLSELDKAKILYNHMWHSDLPDDYIEKIYKDKRYISIIKNKNFNPRLIRFLLEAERIPHLSPSDYWPYILNTLKNPKDVWENPFEVQQDDFSRAIILLTTINGRPIPQRELSLAYARYISLPQNIGMQGRKDLITNLKHLTGSLLNRKLLPPRNTPHLDLFNPSLGDFVLARFKDDTPTLKNAFLCLNSISSLNTLRDLKRNKIIDKTTELDILYEILKDAETNSFNNHSPEYIATACNFILNAIEASQAPTSMVQALEYVLSEINYESFISAASFIEKSLPNPQIDLNRIKDFIILACSRNIDDDELEALSRLFNKLDKITTGLDVTKSHLEEATTVFFEEYASDIFDESEIFRHVNYHDTNSAEENLTNLLESKINRMGITWGVDTSRVISAYDLHAHRESYFSNIDDSLEPTIQRYITSTEEIDDLFSRT